MPIRVWHLDPRNAIGVAIGAAIRDTTIGGAGWGGPCGFAGATQTHTHTDTQVAAISEAVKSATLADMRPLTFALEPHGPRAVPPHCQPDSDRAARLGAGPASPSERGERGCAGNKGLTAMGSLHS